MHYSSVIYLWIDFHMLLDYYTLDAKTFFSVIRESARFTKETDRKCQRLWEDERQETARLHCLRTSEWRSDIRKSQKLLTQIKEVKRLSNLLTVELLVQTVQYRGRWPEDLGNYNTVPKLPSSINCNSYKASNVCFLFTSCIFNDVVACINQMACYYVFLKNSQSDHEAY
jgi:hypothetical protein